jgi:hypothetical protein
MTLLRRLLVSLLIIAIGLPAHAGMLPTQSALSAEPGARERLANLLERRDVRAQLEAYGVNPADVSARVAALTDDEASRLASRLDRLPAGGDGGATVIAALLLVFVILLVTDILGYTNIFPFTKALRQ